MNPSIESKIQRKGSLVKRDGKDTNVRVSQQGRRVSFAAEGQTYKINVSPEKSEDSFGTAPSGDSSSNTDYNDMMHNAVLFTQPKSASLNQPMTPSRKVVGTGTLPRSPTHNEGSPLHPLIKDGKLDLAEALYKLVISKTEYFGRPDDEDDPFVGSTPGKQTTQPYIPPHIRRNRTMSQGSAGQNPSPSIIERAPIMGSKSVDRYVSRSDARRAYEDDDSPAPRRSLRSAPSVSSLEAPKLQPFTTGHSIMNGVSEMSAVEEYAFRLGQADAQCHNDIRQNIFGAHLAHVWARNYQRGRKSFKHARPIKEASGFSPSNNYQWAPLVNPWSQTMEDRNGLYDEHWSRSICSQALEGMKALIADAARGCKDFHRLVCDIPSPIANALTNYPDLMDWYKQLKQEAHNLIANEAPDWY